MATATRPRPADVLLPIAADPGAALTVAGAAEIYGSANGRRKLREPRKGGGGNGKSGPVMAVNVVRRVNDMVESPFDRLT